MSRRPTTRYLLLYVLGPIATVTLVMLGHWFYRFYFAESFSTVFRQFDQGLQELRYTQTEIERLRGENARLMTESHYYFNLTRENPRLREMLGFKQESRYRLMACRVVGRDPSNWWSSVLIGAGWKDDAGISSDLPVVSPRGVVGKTGEVREFVTEVILMVNPNCKMAGTLESAKDRGIVMGESAPSQGGTMVKMRYLPRVSSVAVGERIFTSGMGGVFPPGLFIGTVAEVPALSPQVNFGLYREVVVDPGIDLSQLDELFVIMEGR